jgi:1,4-dihydroxy-2-naphthoyl-CoA synthase
VLDLSNIDLATIALSQPQPGIVVATLNRPERMNSQSFQMFDDLAALPLLLRDESELRALIITGAGDKAFCAGFDLDEIDRLPQLGVREFIKFQELAAGAYAAIRALPVPVIAAVNGAAVGWGMELALMADIRVASERARFGELFVMRGLCCDVAGLGRLATLVGRERASELLFTRAGDRRRRGGRHRARVADRAPCRPARRRTRAGPHHRRQPPARRPAHQAGSASGPRPRLEGAGPPGERRPGRAVPHGRPP